MLCNNCGTNLPDNAKFCTKCGTAIESAPQDAPAPEEVAGAGDATEVAAEVAAEAVSAPEGATVPMPAAAQPAPAAYAAPAAAAAASAYAYAAPAGAAPTYAMPVDPYDHTAKFAQQEISDGKLYAMMSYLMGWVGIIVALLAAKENGYVMFHVRQSLKLTVVNTLLAILTLLLIWTIIVPIAGGVCLLIVFVLKVICFFQVCGGKAKEPAIIRSLGFLK